MCAIERWLNEDDSDDKTHPRGVIPIAGDYALSHGPALDAKWTRLEDEKNEDEKEKKGGLKVELHGGRYPFDDKHGRKQKAVIEFVCDRERTGLEGLVGKADGKAAEMSRSSAGDALDRQRQGDDDAASISREKDRDDDDDDDGDHDKKDPNRENDDKSLRFISYGPDNEEVGEWTLRLEWRTKYACEGMQHGDDGDDDGNSKGSKSHHWGFFTWFIIMWVYFLYPLSFCEQSSTKERG